MSAMTITLTKAKLAIVVVVLTLLIPATAFATHVFTDVPDDRFYSDAVEWALSNGVTTGTTATTFEPDAVVTRGQSVTFAKRYDDNVVQPRLASLETALPFAVMERDDRTDLTQPNTVTVSVEVTAPVSGHVTVNTSTNIGAPDGGDSGSCSISSNSVVDLDYSQYWYSDGIPDLARQLAGVRMFEIAAGETATYSLVCAALTAGLDHHSVATGSVISAIFTPAP
jgi:hypothetical protein